MNETRQFSHYTSRIYQNHRPHRRRFRPGRSGPAPRPRRRAATSSKWPWSAAAAAAPAPPTMPWPPKAARSSSWPWPTSSRTGSTTATRASTKEQRRPGGCAAGPQVHRLRRLQEGDGLPEAGRHCDLDHAAGVPLGAFRLRHREGPERVHGEAGDGGRPDQPQDAQAGRGGGGQEPEGRRGSDVPSQPGAAGTAQAHPGRRNRRHHPHARLPDARAGRARPSQTKWPGDPSELLWQIQHFHSFLWASGGCYSDFYIHHHRPSLLDEERLAGQGPGAGRTPLQAQTPTACPTWTRTSIPIRWNTPLPTAPR